MPVTREVIDVVGRSLDVERAGIAVSVLGHALRTPVRPDAKLRVAVPFRRFAILGERLPCRLIRAVACQTGEGRFQCHAIPSAGRRLAIRPVLPVVEDGVSL